MLQAPPAGLTVTISAKLEKIDGRRLIFDEQQIEKGAPFFVRTVTIG